MAILTKPAIFIKGQDITYSVDKDELASIITDPYYSNNNNWKNIQFHYQHESTSQRTVLLIPIGQTSAVYRLNVQARSGTWSLVRIQIEDYDNGTFAIPREELDTPENYDFISKSNSPNGDLIVRNGETVELTPGTDYLFGDIIIESGGIVKIGAGGGITTLNAAENCIINGTIEANHGEHGAGTWTKTIYGETFVHEIVQSAGGAGGNMRAEDPVAQSNYGNGGGGGRWDGTTFYPGQEGLSTKGGDGAGGSLGGSITGIPTLDGEDGEGTSVAGAGGARGHHGQGILIRAYAIFGGGTINAAGEKGGDGGDGTGGGSGQPAGGGGAGGSGGSVWLRYNYGTPNLNVLVQGGERGLAGWEDTYVEQNAQQGTNGAIGIVSIVQDSSI